VVFELVMTLFKLLLYHTFKHDEAGFKVIEETLGLLELFERKVLVFSLPFTSEPYTWLG
jgi:hypothetical protein